jgi:HK97 family phage major capsid protein/HK97 family phage prohead protease
MSSNTLHALPPTAPVGPGVQRTETRRWNPRLSKAFDVAREAFPARSQEEALVAKYLEVEIKHLERREIRVPSVRMGALLTAVDDVLRTWSVDDIRNLNYRGEETPPIYDIIQLNSTKSADFLIDGMRFVRQAEPTGPRATLRVEPAWYGLDVTVYGMRSLGTAELLLGAVQQRASEINFLKGEAFSLSGEFLPKTDETFADLFLDPKNAAALERVISLVNTKGKALENRGVLLMGPPGTGKTLAARIVRNDAKATFIWVSSRDFHYSGSFGGFSQAFDLARECAPSVVVFEDIDNWMYDTTVDLIKTEMDGVARSTGVVTMMTTNYPELLPAALIDRPGRFHDVLQFDLPTDDARTRMLVKWLPGLAPADLTRAVSATKGYSGAHVRELARFATIIAEQDGLSPSQALTAALTKLAEQRDLITATQRAGSRYRMAPALAQKAAAAGAKAPVAGSRRAYALLRVKSIDEGRRIVTGVATTPEADRDGDIVEPLGVTFKNPLPFLFHHDARKPIGTVRFDPPTKDGITFQAEIPAIVEPGALKDRLDEAWQSVKAGLIAGVSIGYRELAGGVEVLKSGGLRFLKIEVFELSLVTVPANAGATIRTIKSLDLAASGRHTPGVTGSLPIVRAQKDAPPMNIQEQITSFENTRAAKAAARDALMANAAETGDTLDQAQSDSYDDLDREIKSVDAHLVRLRALETSNVAAATRIVPVSEAEKAAALRGGVITVKSLLPKGTGFTRYAMAIAMAKGNLMQAEQIAKQRWHDSTPEVELMIKAAIAAGTTTDATWAAPLVPALQNLTSEFLELLRPATVIGNMPNLRKVPFNVSVASQTQGGTYGWVGQGKAKPLSALAFAAVTLGFAKVAGIIVLTKELVKLSSPSAEQTVRDDMIAGIAGFMDAQFIDPAVAEVATVNPASITNGTVAIASSGPTPDNARTDIKALVASFVAGNLSTLNAVIIMSEANAFALGVALNPLGQPFFPGLGAKGGVLLGIPVITSQAAGALVILVDQRSILFADDGQVAIDVSEEASLEMDSVPTEPTAAATVMVSLWQRNMIGLRAERFCSWKRARLTGVKYVSGAAYV